MYVDDLTIYALVNNESEKRKLYKVSLMNCVNGQINGNCQLILINATFYILATKITILHSSLKN